jgi:hypothetical protein
MHIRDGWSPRSLSRPKLPIGVVAVFKATLPHVDRAQFGMMRWRRNGSRFETGDGKVLAWGHEVRIQFDQ